MLLKRAKWSMRASRKDCEVHGKVVVIEVEVEVEAAAAAAAAAARWGEGRASKAAFGIRGRGNAFGGRFGRRRS